MLQVITTALIHESRPGSPDGFFVLVDSFLAS